jgi:hypothetical protein
MKALLKTLIGDVWNLSTVAVVVLAAVALIESGHADLAAFIIPPLALAGVGWLARH